jgi:hypothetical protein
MVVFSGYPVSSKYGIKNLNNQINQVSRVNKANTMQLLKGYLLKVVYSGLNQMKLT